MHFYVSLGFYTVFQWLKLRAWKVRDRGVKLHSGFQVSKKKIFFLRSLVVGNLRDREVACSTSDRQGSNFESCAWRAMASHLSHHPQEIIPDPT